MHIDPNPYAPPRLIADARGRAELHPGGDVDATCIYRGWLSRRILLSGRINAEVRYEGWGFGERVFVNDRPVAKTSPWDLHNVAPHIDFSIDCGDLHVAA